MVYYKRTSLKSILNIKKNINVVSKAKTFTQNTVNCE